MYRPEVDNTVVKGKLFENIRDALSEHRMNVIKVIRIRDDRFVFHVFLDDGKEVKLNILKKKIDRRTQRHIKKCSLQNILYKKGVNVPRCICWWEGKSHLWKVSEWVKGKRLDELWDYKEPIIAGGEQVAKINSTIDPKTKNPLVFKDFSPLNSVWTEDKKLYIIDVDVWPGQDIDMSVVRILIGELKSRNRALAFLEGYEKIRDISGVKRILERDNWTWRKIPLVESGEMI